MNYLIETQAQLDALSPLFQQLDSPEQFERIDSPEQFERINSPEQLNSDSPNLMETSIVAVDTEFLREKTYNAKLCLVQLGIGQDQYCIDVLAIDDLSLLAEMFANENILKLLHAARQDMEVIYQTFNVLPKPIFDTQLAAAFCGADMQIGYSAMVEERLGIELPKSQARTDWTRRPLSEEQVQYAGDDVAHLEELYRGELSNLEQSNKLEWYQQELQSYYEPGMYVIDPALAYQRLNGGSLKIAQQYTLKALAQWREEMAQTRDIPRSWVLRDDKLFDLAIKRPKKAEDVIEMNVLGRKSAHRLAPKVANVIASTTVGEERIWRKVEPLTKQQKSQCSKLMKELAAFSQQHNVAQALMGTRKDVESLYRHRQSKKLMNGWRKGMVGEPLLASLRDSSS